MIEKIKLEFEVGNYSLSDDESIPAYVELRIKDPNIPESAMVQGWGEGNILIQFESAKDLQKFMNTK